MLLEAKVTSQGQVTIPVAIRKKFNVSHGGIIAFHQQGDQVFIERPNRHRTIEERFENYNLDEHQGDIEEAMLDVPTGEVIGDEWT